MYSTPPLHRALSTLLVLGAAACSTPATSDAGFVRDVGVDGGADAAPGHDVGVDAGADGGVDAGADVGVDAGADAAPDVDGGVDGGADAAVEPLPTYCGHPSDCTGSELCAPDGVCRSGPCGASSPCIFGYACTAGVCTGAPGACDADFDCAPGALCLAGSDGLGATCTPVAGQCFDRAQCGAGQVCADGRCVLACTSDPDCRDGFRCDTARGLCTTRARSCTLTSDCLGATMVCVGGACVPRSSGASCPGAGDVWTENGCVPDQAPHLTCTTEGALGSGGGVSGVSCALGSICLHGACWISCDAPDENACATQAVLTSCKPVTSGGTTYDVCGTATNLGDQCGVGALDRTCSGTAICIDGFCR